jgi:hypothetical protein
MSPGGFEKRPHGHEARTSAKPFFGLSWPPFAVTKLPDTADLAIVDVADLIHRGTGLRDIAD